jgi:hypothetical protein
MKRAMPWLVLPIAVTAALVGAASAGAVNGNGTTVKPFTVTYPDGAAHCAGVRIQRAGAHPLIRDLETCVTTITALAPTGGTSSPSTPRGAATSTGSTRATRRSAAG